MAVINGTAGNDTLNGTAGDDTINGLAGDDTINGGTGVDTINGGAGADAVHAGDGNDIITVGLLDTVHGDNDDDSLTYVSGLTSNSGTYVYGDAGTDKLTLNFSSATDSLTSNNYGDGSGYFAGLYYSGMESLWITGGSASDTIIGGIGDDHLTGGAGADRLDGGKGLNVIVGGTGLDIGLVDISDSNTAHTVNFTANVNLAVGGNALSGIEGLGLKTGGGVDKINVSGETIGSEIYSGAGNDILTGGDAADYMSAGAGNDTITAGAGDTVHGDADDDSISYTADTAPSGTYLYGDVGIDKVTFNFASAFDPITATTYNDGSGYAGSIYYSGMESVWITGGSASDNLSTGIGNDHLTGGGGNDRLNGGAGLNVIVGGTGLDIGLIDQSATTQARVIVFDPATTLSVGGNQLSQIEGLGYKGGTGNDSIDVSAEIIGSELDGGGGNDTIVGGNKADALNGGIGDDTITAGEFDTTHGNDGDDTISMVLKDNNASGTYTYGDLGIDKLTVSLSTVADAVTATTYNDGSGYIAGMYYAGMEQVWITGGTASDNIATGIGDDHLTGGAGDDRLDGGAGSNVIVGGAGNDIGLIDLSATATARAVNFNPAGTLNLGGNQLSQIEGLGLKTGDGNDVINISAALIGNEIYTNGGNDTVTGAAGSADIINTGNGDDTIIAGKGDNVHGGSGDDDIRLTLSDAAAGTYVYGDADIDKLTINFAASTVAITTSNYGDGSGYLGSLYFQGIETLVVTGSANNDSLIGGAGSDTFVGGAGNDTLNGGAGNDFLTGGAGADTLNDSVGNDRFRYTDISESTYAAAGRDTIVSFATGDKIDLSAIDANGATAGDPAFVFKGTAAFSNVGQIRYEASGADTLVLINTTGDLNPDMAILVNGAHTFVAGDFIL